MALSKESTSGINKIEAKRQEVIDYILTEINNGNPHVFNNPNHPSLFEQYNFKTDKTYNGMNRFILAISASIEGYKDPRWLTFKQAKELGYSVKKGSHGTTLEYWERIPDTMDKLNKDGNPVLDENGKIVQVPITREDGTQVMRWMGKPFTVFNGEQINGIPPYERQPMTEEQRIKELESILNHSEASILYDSLEDNYYQKSTDTGNYYSDNLILKGKAAQQFLTDAARQDYFYSELGYAKCSFTIKVKDFEFGDRFDLGDSYIKAANLDKKGIGGIEYFNNFLVKTFDVDPHTLESLVAQEQQLIAEGKLPSIVNCPNGQIITNDMNQDNLISSTKEQNTVKFDKNFAISIRHKEGLLCHNTNMIVIGGGTSFDYLLHDTPEKMLGPDDSYREYGGHFYALDHDPESPNLYKGDYAIQLMNDVVLEDMTVHLVNANRTITLADGTGFDSQNPSNVRSCLGCYDKLGINFHIIDKNGEFHTFESRIDLGDLDTISKTPMLDVLKSMEKWTSVKLEGLSDDVHAMVEELEDRLKRNELPSPSVQTNPKIYTEKLQALYNSHSNPEKYAEALKPVKEMLNVTQTKDLSQKPKVGLSISKPKGKSGLER